MKTLPLIDSTVEWMKANPGLYLRFDPENTNHGVAMASMGGEILSLKIDSFLRDDGYIPTHHVVGPFTAEAVTQTPEPTPEKTFIEVPARWNLAAWAIAGKSAMGQDVLPEIVWAMNMIGEHEARQTLVPMDPAVFVAFATLFLVAASGDKPAIQSALHVLQKRWDAYLDWKQETTGEVIPRHRFIEEMEVPQA